MTILSQQKLDAIVTTSLKAWQDTLTMSKGLLHMASIEASMQELKAQIELGCHPLDELATDSLLEEYGQTYGTMHALGAPGDEKAAFLSQLAQALHEHFLEHFGQAEADPLLALLNEIAQAHLSEGSEETSPHDPP